MRAAAPALLVIAAALAPGLAPAAAAAQAPAPGLRLDKPRVGVVGAQVTGRPGATGEVRELRRAGERTVSAVQLDGAGRATLARLATWRCTPRRRAFVVVLTREDGKPERSAVARIRTPACRDRLGLRVAPRHLRAGRRLTVVVRDRWRLGGVRLRLCRRPPGGQTRCRNARIASGRPALRLRVRVRRRGIHRVALRYRRRVVARPFVVRRPGGPLRLLATGDSMIQIVDAFLAQRLRGRPRTRVRSEAHISTGISKLGMFHWLRAARRQAQRDRPDATVVFLGANDGFPMRAGRTTAQCCGRAWVREYARRARVMMRAYLRAGRGRVYWCLLPVPRRAAFARVYRAVNRASRRAARRFPAGVRLVDLPRVFTPGGRFRAQMRDRGRIVTVRQGDGIHLNRTGASIAARVILRALRRDGLIR